MNSAVEQVAEDAKLQLQIGNSLAATISLLKKNGFSCQPLADRTKELGQPSFLCGKMVEEKRWLGIITDYNHVRVVIDDDGDGNVATADVEVIWGGLRGL